MLAPILDSFGSFSIRDESLDWPGLQAGRIEFFGDFGRFATDSLGAFLSVTAPGPDLS
jgi:hypothetical protein